MSGPPPLVVPVGTDGAWTLAPMRWWHLEAVAELERQIFGPSAWSLEQFYGELAAEGRWLQVVLCSAPGRCGEVAGYVDVALSGRDADLMTIAVAPMARRGGVGGQLLDLALAAATAAGADRMLLEVRAGNPAEALYRSRGFEAIDRRRDYYGDGGDALVMRRLIGAAVTGQGGDGG